MDEDSQSRKLVNRFLETRSEADFRLLYRAHTPALYRLALHLFNGDTKAAEDSVQELWIRAIKGLPGFLGASAVRTWLTAILLNLFRESQREATAAEGARLELERSLTHAAMNRQDIQLDVSKALSRLPAGYKEILLLHDLEGYKHEEIGTLLGISPGTSKSQLYHARQAMKKLLV